MAFRLGPEAGQGKEEETKATSTKAGAGENIIRCRHLKGEKNTKFSIIKSENNNIKTLSTFMSRKKIRQNYSLTLTFR